MRDDPRESPPPPIFTIRERVRWSDVDAAGIVCYGAYLRFFEIAETELFRAAGLPPAVLSERYRIWLVRRRVECDFHDPVRLDDELEVAVAPGRIGRTSIELLFTARRTRDGVLVAGSRYVLVVVGRRSLRPEPIPADLRARLQAFDTHATRIG